jgi:hypothetical protein
LIPGALHASGILFEKDGIDYEWLKDRETPGISPVKAK